MLALSLVLLPATDAGAALRSAGSGTGLVSDGRRWAFWSKGPGVRVFDDVRGAVRSMRGLGPCASRWGVAAVKPAHGWRS